MKNPMNWTRATLYNAEHQPLRSWPLDNLLGEIDAPAIREAVAAGKDYLETPGLPTFYVFS